MQNFDYFEPKTLKEAIGILVKWKRGARLLAGGTDLMVEMKEGFVKPKCLINLKKIKGLDRIAYSKKEGLRIGSLATWRDILSSEPVRLHYPILQQAASLIGCPQIRNRGTIGGNICHASPSADAAPALHGALDQIVHGLRQVVVGHLGADDYYQLVSSQRDLLLVKAKRPGVRRSPFGCLGRSVRIPALPV